MTEPTYPRVLIIGQSFDPGTGGGITLTNLFTGWPKDRIAVVSRLDFAPSTSVCERYYRLGSADLRLVWPLRYLWPNSEASGALVNFENDKLSDNAQSIIANDYQPTSARINFWGKCRKSVHEVVVYLGVDQLVRRVRITPDLRRWIKNYQPDLIYTQLPSLHMIRLTTQLYHEFSVPFSIHIMDDWPSTLYTRKTLSPYLRFRLCKEYDYLLNRAVALMGISEKMCRAFEERYGRRFLPFHNAIDMEYWLREAKKTWEASSPFRLAYTGRVGQANQHNLEDVCNAVADMYDTGFQIRFDLFTLDYHTSAARSLERTNSVFVLPSVPYQDMPATLAGADLLILPLDFDPVSFHFAQYSMPTKTPEYMVSGTPVLVYAPGNLAVSEYARENGWGYTVTKKSLSSLKEGIVQLMGSSTLREKLGRKAQELAIRNHDALKVREAFRQVLMDASRERLMKI